jgi:hypothetical protein
MMEFLKTLDNFPEFIRQAIQEKIERTEGKTLQGEGKN